MYHDSMGISTTTVGSTLSINHSKDRCRVTCGLSDMTQTVHVLFITVFWKIWFTSTHHSTSVLWSVIFFIYWAITKITKITISPNFYQNGDGSWCRSHILGVLDQLFCFIWKTFIHLSVNVVMEQSICASATWIVANEHVNCFFLPTLPSTFWLLRFQKQITQYDKAVGLVM